MFRSMTAYGRAVAETEQAQFLIEIHSVNRKSLDIAINLPREFLFLDIELRKRLGEEVKRGVVTVRISRESAQTREGFFMPSLELMKKLKKSWDHYAEKLGYDPKEESSFHELLTYSLSQSNAAESDETGGIALIKGFEEALKAFIAMRENEGAALLKDVYPRLDIIEREVEEVGKLSEKAPEKYQEKLKKRLEELELLKEEGEERVLRELVLFADRIDVIEELTRLHSHIGQFRDILASEKRRIGRELDFLLQEMNREINTVGSKSQDIKITQSVLVMKTELERIREQMQNIE